MDKQTFDILSLSARYWFIALLGLILARLVFSLAAGFAKRGRKSEPSFGLLEVVEPINNPLCGKRFSLRQENRIGRASKCDIRLKDKSVRATHCLVFQRSNRVYLTDYAAAVELNGARVSGDVQLADGDEIRLGRLLLLVRISSKASGQLKRKEAFDHPSSPAPAPLSPPFAARNPIKAQGFAKPYPNGGYGEYSEYGEDCADDERYEHDEFAAYDDGQYEDEYDEYDEYDEDAEDDDYGEDDEYDESDEYDEYDDDDDDYGDHLEYDDENGDGEYDEEYDEYEEYEDYEDDRYQSRQRVGDERAKPHGGRRRR